MGGVVVGLLEVASRVLRQLKGPAYPIESFRCLQYSYVMWGLLPLLRGLLLAKRQAAGTPFKPPIPI